MRFRDARSEPARQYFEHPHIAEKREKGSPMRKIQLLLLLTINVTLLAGNAMADEDLIERGRYLIQVSGCNDCHTDGYLASNGEIPVSEWLAGDSFGWNGPWGTTYGSNLRLFLQNMTETQWISAAKTLKRLPPMPWFNLNVMSDEDLRAIYFFTKSLGNPGKPAPATVPPGMQANPPFAIFPAP